MSELNRVDREKILQVIRDNGLSVDEQSAYFKCSYGSGKQKIYVAKTKKVTRVDLGGFGHGIDHPAVKHISPETAKELRLGKVRGQLDFEKSEEEILDALVHACRELKELSVTVEVPAVEVVSTEETPEPADSNEVESVDEDNTVDLATRRELIKNLVEGDGETEETAQV